MRARVGVEALYAPYVAMQVAERARVARDEGLALDPALDYAAVPGLSMVERAALAATRPENLGQARRVEGVTPAGCVRLLRYVQRARASEGPEAEAEAEVAGLEEVVDGEDMETVDAKARAADF